MEGANLQEVTRLNCWEFRRCGRVPGGSREGECGVCPVVTESRLDAVHSGINAGRVCWFIEGTLCDMAMRCKPSGSGNHVEKFKRCLKCNFYNYVKQQEQGRLISPAEAHSLLRK